MSSNNQQQQEPSPSPGGSNFARNTNMRQGGAPEQSNLQELSQS